MVSLVLLISTIYLFARSLFKLDLQNITCYFSTTCLVSDFKHWIESWHHMPISKMHWDRYVLILAFLNRNWLRSQLWAMIHCHQPMLLMPILGTSQTVQIWRIQAFWECFSDLSCPILIQTILIHHNYKMKGKSKFLWLLLSFCKSRVGRYGEILKFL